MALTPLRWVAIAIAGMLTFCILAFSERKWPEPTPDVEEANRMYMAASLHNTRATAFVRQYRMARIADSLRSSSARGAVAPIRVSHAANVSPVVRAAVDSAVAFARGRLGDSARMGVDVVTLLDTVSISGLRPWPSSLLPIYVLPQRHTDRCTVVFPLGYDNTERAIASAMGTEDARLQILGPCAYYAAFGMPGAQVREWLRQRGALMALGGSWTRNYSSNPAEASLGSFTAPTYYPTAAPQLFVYSARAVTCLVGDASACESVVLDVGPGRRQSSVGSAVRVGYRLGPITARDATEFAGRETELLADMVRSLGKERFARFWTSNESVPTAFQAASGMALGEWVSAWGAENIDPIEHGPTIPASTLLGGLGIAGACLLIAVFAARRRQFA